MNQTHYDPNDQRADLEIHHPFLTTCITECWYVFSKDMMFGFLHGADMMAVNKNSIFVEDELRFLKILCRFRD